MIDFAREIKGTIRVRCTVFWGNAFAYDIRVQFGVNVDCSAIAMAESVLEAYTCR